MIIKYDQVTLSVLKQKLYLEANNNSETQEGTLMQMIYHMDFSK